MAPAVFYLTADWSMALLHGNRPLHRNKFNFDSDKTKNHPTRNIRVQDWINIQSILKYITNMRITV